MYDRLLVPTDGSNVATGAGEAAVALADKFDADLHAIFVLERANLPAGFESEAGEERLRLGRAALDEIVDGAGGTDLDITTTVLENEGRNPVHQTIIDYSVEHGIDLVVMGTHGRTGISRMVLGSVAEQTLRESPVPVMTIHENTTFDPDLDSVLVPTDGSDSAGAALDHAIELALATDAAIHIVNVVDIGVVTGDYDAGRVLEALNEAGERTLEVAIHRAKDAGVSTVEATVARGRPHQAITDYAEQRDVDAIVMGTHGRTGVARFILGSVTERVVRHTDVPVIATKAATSDEHNQ